MRLDSRFRLALYSVFWVLFVTGACWLPADRMKDAATSSEAWQLAGANLLMIHGAAAMVTLMLLGALVPLHMQRGWRGRRNRLTGTAMLAGNAILIVTSFGLYYAGSEVVRPWIKDIHTVIGLSLPALFLVHVVTGKRNAHGDAFVPSPTLE